MQDAANACGSKCGDNDDACLDKCLDAFVNQCEDAAAAKSCDLVSSCTEKCFPE